MQKDFEEIVMKVLKHNLLKKEKTPYEWQKYYAFKNKMRKVHKLEIFKSYHNFSLSMIKDIKMD